MSQLGRKSGDSSEVEHRQTLPSSYFISLIDLNSKIGNYPRFTLHHTYTHLLDRSSFIMYSTFELVLKQIQDSSSSAVICTEFQIYCTYVVWPCPQLTNVKHFSPKTGLQKTKKIKNYEGKKSIPRCSVNESEGKGLNPCQHKKKPTPRFPKHDFW